MSTTRSVNPPRTAGPIGVVRTIAADIKLTHSVFALPFAVLAAFSLAIHKFNQVQGQ